APSAIPCAWLVPYCLRWTSIRMCARVLRHLAVYGFPFRLHLHPVSTGPCISIPARTIMLSLQHIPLWLWRLAFAVCLLAVLTLALLPDPDPRLSTGWDKGNHLLAFAVLTFLGCAAFPGRWLPVAVA